MVPTLDYVRQQYQRLNQQGSVPKGMPPRTTISDALVAQFCDLVEFLKSEVVLEIGAHEASFSQEMRRRLPNSTIWAFEANPHVFEKYKDRVTNSASGIRYEWRAVSDSNDELELFIPTSIRGRNKPLDSRMGSLNQLSSPTAEGTVVRVPGGTLDEILSDHLGKPTALWIDVEGAVDRVLGGAQSVMATAQVVMCEVESASIWSKQSKDTEIVAEFDRLNFAPALMDCQSPHQYNIVFINNALMDDQTIKSSIETFHSQVVGILEAHFGQPE